MSPQDAAKTLLRIAGEQADVPDERLAETLTKIANDYKRLQEQVAVLNPENPVAKKLVEQARPEIDAGHFERARDLLREAVQAQLAAADQARKARRSGDRGCRRPDARRSKHNSQRRRCSADRASLCRGCRTLRGKRLHMSPRQNQRNEKATYNESRTPFIALGMKEGRTSRYSRQSNYTEDFCQKLPASARRSTGR